LNPVIELRGAGRTFALGSVATQALRPTTLEIAAGEYVAVTGRSGSGKSTLLNLICGIDRPTCGSVRVAGTDLGTLRESALSRLRGERIGIVFQFFELIATLTALENVVLAMDLVGVIPAAKRRARAQALLEEMGIADQARKLPWRLSGGEQQRVAISRALANDPPIVVADEPSGNLDSKNADVVHGLFARSAAQGRTVVVATHERIDLQRYDRVLQLVDGELTPPVGAP
jgi:putative ABC transport system ATP-binding protein